MVGVWVYRRMEPQLARSWRYSLYVTVQTRILWTGGRWSLVLGPWVLGCLGPSFLVFGSWWGTGAPVSM